MSELMMIYTALALVGGTSLTPLAAGGFMPFQDSYYLWKTIGFLGIGIFQTRFLIQWLYSERHGESRIPEWFWWQSIVGSLLCLLYFLRQQDSVGIAGYALGFIPYIRNLMLVHRKKHRQAPEAIPLTAAP